jgi:hypothetical protein
MHGDLRGLSTQGYDVGVLWCRKNKKFVHLKNIFLNLRFLVEYKFKIEGFCMTLVVGSIFLTYGGYCRIGFGADQSIFSNDETAKRLADEFWNEVDRLSVVPAMTGRRGEKLMAEQAV